MTKFNLSRTFVGVTLLVSIVATHRPVHAALVLELGGRQLRADLANQPIDLFIRSTYPGNDPADISGVQLNIFLGDGSGNGMVDNPEPIFSSTTVFSDGPGGRDYIWDAFPGLALSPSGTPPQFNFDSFSFNAVGGSTPTIRPDGLLATLFVDTTGFTEGAFRLTLTGDPALPLSPTELLTSDGSVSTFTLDFPLADESDLFVAAVPEPGAIAFCGSVGLAWMLRRRRNRVGAAIG